MGEEQINPRSVIQGRLGYRLYDCVWNRALRNYGFENKPEQLQELVEAAEDLQQFAEAVKQELESSPTTKPRRSMDSVRYRDKIEPDSRSFFLLESFYIDSDSRAALRALSSYAALKANKHPRVVEFRARTLRKGYLDPEQATNLLYSYTARFLTLDQMRDLGIPLSGHKTSLLGPYREVDREGYFDHKVSLRVEPPGISLRLRYTNLVDSTANKEELIRCEVEGDVAVAPYKISLPPVEVPGTKVWTYEADESNEESRRIKVGPMLLSGFDTADRPANVWPGSLVDEIYALAQELSEFFMWPSHLTSSWEGTWWNKNAAALFVLAGIAPLVHPIKVSLARAKGSVDIPTHVALEVLPWLHPDSIVEYYQSIRRSLNVNLRNQGALKFDVVTFVLQNSESCDPETLDFRQLRESWNVKFPKKQFKDTSSFSTYFKRGLDAVEERYYL